MKSMIFFTILLSVAAKLSAQFVVGDTDLTVKSGVLLSVDGLSLTPVSDFTLSDNSLEKSGTVLTH